MLLTVSRCSYIYTMPRSKRHILVGVEVEAKCCWVDTRKEGLEIRMCAHHMSEALEPEPVGW